MLRPSRTCDLPERQAKGFGTVIYRTKLTPSSAVGCDHHFTGWSRGRITDARNFILTVPVSSESLPRLIEPADSRWSLQGIKMPGSLTSGVQRTRTWDPHLRGGGCPQTSPCDAVYRMYTHHRRAGPMKRCVADAKVMLLINHGLGSRVRSPETTDLVEGGVVTEKRRTPEDTREHHTQ